MLQVKLDQLSFQRIASAVLRKCFETIREVRVSLKFSVKLKIVRVSIDIFMDFQQVLPLIVVPVRRNTRGVLACNIIKIYMYICVSA